MPPSQRDREDSSEMIASLRMAYTRGPFRHKVDPLGVQLPQHEVDPQALQGHKDTRRPLPQPKVNPLNVQSAQSKVDHRALPRPKGIFRPPQQPEDESLGVQFLWHERLQEQEDRDNSGDEYRGDQEETNKDDAQTEDEDADGADILDASNTNAKTPTTRKDKIFTTVTPMSQAAKEYTLPQGVRRATVAELEALSDYHNQGDTTYQWLNRMPAIFKTKPEKTATGQKNCPAAVDNLYLDLSFRRITRMLAFQRLKIEVPELTPFHHLIDIPTPNTK
ncbi:hypothetical protein N0V95_001634 [Ascochyta clinopodiicola]|nr:hypothetical protein N0V95_001634 [Ascochyta clinopodiicola]